MFVSERNQGQDTEYESCQNRFVTVHGIHCCVNHKRLVFLSTLNLFDSFTLQFSLDHFYLNLQIFQQDS